MARALACALLTAPAPPPPRHAKVMSPPPPASGAASAAARTSQAAHFTRSLSPCGNCGRVVGAQAFSFAPPPGGGAATTSVAAIAAAAAAAAAASDANGRCYCSADCYWSATLDARGALRRRTKMGRRPARVVAGAGTGACDGDKKGGDGGDRAGGKAGGVCCAGCVGEKHAMYAHHVDVLQSSYCGGKTKA